MMSVVFACLAGACLLLTRTGSARWDVALFAAAAAFIPLRLVSNLLDGMVAVEGGRKTKSGEIFNELPDRLSDAIVLACAGYSITAVSWGSDLGWAASVVALITAYVRTLGAASGTSQHFTGPMAKQHRMAVIAIACLVAGVEVALERDPFAMAVALSVVLVGGIVTVARRTWAIVRELESG
jgi:phosphatidylglycerophosphate synthase